MRICNPLSRDLLLKNSTSSSGAFLAHNVFGDCKSPILLTSELQIPMGGGGSVVLTHHVFGNCKFRRAVVETCYNKNYFTIEI